MFKKKTCSEADSIKNKGKEADKTERNLKSTEKENITGSTAQAMTTELPLDHTSVVPRDPHRFGDMQKNNQTKVVEIRLHRVPTELARGEKKYMLQCEREGGTLRARYQDINTKDRIRCPSPYHHQYQEFRK